MRWMLILGIGSFLLGGGGCANSSVVGRNDGGGDPPDAGAPDAGDDAGRCPLRCGAECCAAADECLAAALSCAPVCDHARCGTSDQTCCGDGELCIGEACVPPGGPCIGEGDCPGAETCEPLLGRCVPVPPDAVCQFIPREGFDPRLRWHWDGGQVALTPIVVQLTDDDDDGRISGTDIPDVVAVAYRTVDDGPAFDYARTWVVALSGDDGRELWTYEPAGSFIEPVFAHPTAGDLDGDGTVEILVVGQTGSSHDRPGEKRMIALGHDGALEWTSPVVIWTGYNWSSLIADLDANGSPEIVMPGFVLDSVGALRFTFTLGGDRFGRGDDVAVVDVDDDGMLEIVGGDRAIRADGSTLWDRGDDGDWAVAIARIIESEFFEGPQIVATNLAQWIVASARTGEILAGPGRFIGTPLLENAPPTVGDFDGDGRPEIGIAATDISQPMGSQGAYVAIDPTDESLGVDRVMWRHVFEEPRGTTGSTLFDFQNDGRVEVVFANECQLRVLDGRTGVPIFTVSNSSWTGTEYPVVADVDADGNAEIVVISNDHQMDAAYCASRTRLPFEGLVHGVRVFEDAADQWVATRAIWNQHHYSIDNVTDDGAIPRTPAAGWSTHNSYRLNRIDQPFLAPDLRIAALRSDATRCPDAITLYARVTNAGSRGVREGVPVSFYAAGAIPGTHAPLATVHTTERLLAGDSTWVEARLVEPTLGPDGALPFFAVADDDGGGNGEHSECIEDNNASEPAVADCRGPI